MGTSGIVLCDTNIFIELFKGNQEVVKEVQKIRDQNVAISIVSASELVYGALNKKELAVWMRNIEDLITFQLDEAISERAFELMKRYSLSHDLDLPDSLIAATALVKGVPLYTLNVKGFRYIEGINLYGK